jgi:hypothetical protein
MSAVFACPGLLLPAVLAASAAHLPRIDHCAGWFTNPSLQILLLFPPFKKFCPFSSFLNNCTPLWDML